MSHKNLINLSPLVQPYVSAVASIDEANETRSALRGPALAIIIGTCSDIPYLSFNVDKPNSTRMMVMIQNLTTT